MISSAYVMELAVIGGRGGAPFDHRAALEQQGAGTLGCGARGMRLSGLHIESWAVLSHVKATYTLMKDPHGATVAAPAFDNVRIVRQPADIEIAPDERVALVSCEHRFHSWQAGAHCLSALRLEIEGPDGLRRAALAVGCHLQDFPDHAHRVPGHTSEFDGDLDVVVFPEGLTLAGIAGRAGDSWDQVRLLACPFLPGPAWAPALHRRCPPPFREQTRALLLSLARLSKGGGGGGSSHDDRAGGGDGGGGTGGGDGACSAAGAALPQLVLEALVGALYDVTFFGEQGSGDDCIARWMARQLAPPPPPRQPQEQQPAARGGRAPGSRWRGWGWGRGR